MNVIPVIMAGGSGTRLWPLSRQLNPKQFLSLICRETSLFQDTLTRLDGFNMAAPILICNEEHRFLAAEQLRQSKTTPDCILLEPEGRNTAPAIALAALRANKKGDDPLLLVLAADHNIADVSAFRSSVLTAIPVADEGKLITFGVVPSYPETGYGYIQKGRSLAHNVSEVLCFVEKPNEATAQRYLETGDYFWNSGMFLFRASQYLAELNRHRPDIFSVCERAMAGASEDMDFIRVAKDVFKECPSESVDYAVMEHTDNAAVVSLDARWSDVGSWSSLWEVCDKDENGNSYNGDVISKNCRDSLVRAEHRLVATVGIQDLIVVETKDAVLVAHKNSVQDVKKVVEQLKRDGRHEHINHREVYRPWGVYDSVDKGERYQVKRITVRPGAKLSVQMHHHRAEHWIVVSGTAKVTNGKETYLVTENQSTYIPVGQVHALENPGVIPLELIEVQSGSYLGEDDIVRIKDQYGRA